jgi:MFS family permease
MGRDLNLLMGARTSMSMVRALAGIVTPLYLTASGYSAVELGLLFTVVAATGAVISIAIGVFTPRFGHKPFLILLPTLTGVAGVAFGLTASPLPIFLFAALGTFGRGEGGAGGNVGPYYPAEHAMLAALAPPERRTAVFARFTLAAALGGLAGAQLAWLPDIAPAFGLTGTSAYHPAFFVIAALAFLTGGLTIPIADPSPAPAGRRVLALPQRSRGLFWRLAVTNSVNGVESAFFGPFLAYWFAQRYGVGPGEIGFLLAAVNLATLLSNLGADRVAQRLGLVRGISLARGFQAALLALMALAPSFWLAGALYLLRQLANRVQGPLKDSYVIGMAAPDERAAVVALSNLPAQTTGIGGQIAAGYAFAYLPLAIPFELSALAQGLNAVLFYLFFRHWLPPEERPPEPTGRVGTAESPRGASIRS